MKVLMVTQWNCLRWHILLWLIVGIFTWLLCMDYSSFEVWWTDGYHYKSIPVGLPILSAMLGARLWLDDLRPGRREYFASLPLSFSKLFFGKLLFGVVTIFCTVGLYLVLTVLNIPRLFHGIFSWGSFVPMPLEATGLLLTLGLLVFFLTSLFALQFKRFINARQAGVPGFILGLYSFLTLSAALKYFDSSKLILLTIMILSGLFIWALWVLFIEQAPMQMGDEAKPGQAPFSFWHLMYGIKGRTSKSLEQNLDKAVKLEKGRSGQWLASLFISLLLTLVGWITVYQWASKMVTYEPLTQVSPIVLSSFPFMVIGLAMTPWLYIDARRRGYSVFVTVIWLLFSLTPYGWVFYFFTRPDGSMLECSGCSKKRLNSLSHCPFCTEKVVKASRSDLGIFAKFKSFVLMPWVILIVLWSVVPGITKAATSNIFGRPCVVIVQVNGEGFEIYEDGQKLDGSRYEKKIYIPLTDKDTQRSYNTSMSSDLFMGLEQKHSSFYPLDLLDENSEFYPILDKNSAHKRRLLKTLFSKIGNLSFRFPEGDVVIFGDNGNASEMLINLDDGDYGSDKLIVTFTVMPNMSDVVEKVDKVFKKYSKKSASEYEVKQWAEKSINYWSHYNFGGSEKEIFRTKVKFRESEYTLVNKSQIRRFTPTQLKFYQAMIKEKLHLTGDSRPDYPKLLAVLKAHLNNGGTLYDPGKFTPFKEQTSLNFSFIANHYEIFYAFQQLGDDGIEVLEKEAESLSRASAYCLFILALRQDEKYKSLFMDLYKKYSDIENSVILGTNREVMFAAAVFGLVCLGDDESIAPLLKLLRRYPDPTVIHMLGFSRNQKAYDLLLELSRVDEQELNKAYRKVKKGILSGLRHWHIFKSMRHIELKHQPIGIIDWG